MRSILAFMLSLVVTLLIFVFVPLLLIVIAAAIVFAIASLLTRFFSVTTFEAALIITVVALPIVWIYARLLRVSGFLGGELPEPETPAGQISTIVEPFIAKPSRRRGGGKSK